MLQILLEPWLLRYARYNSKNKKIEEGKVSIIIATYNRSRILINRTLPAALNQTYKNIEVIVVGDSCIDDTSLKIKGIKDDRLRFFDLAKRGVYPKEIEKRWFVQGSVPRNYGMKIAKGEWFMFISDDDVMYEDQVETLIKFAKENDLEFASAGYKTIKNGKALLVYPGKLNYKSDLVCGGMQTWIYKSYLKCFKWNRHSWRKKFDRPVDYDLQKRFYRSGVVMGWTNEIVYFNPEVEGTNSTGYLAAIEAEKLAKDNMYQNE